MTQDCQRQNNDTNANINSNRLTFSRSILHDMTLARRVTASTLFVTSSRKLPRGSVLAICAHTSTSSRMKMLKRCSRSDCEESYRHRSAHRSRQRVFLLRSTHLGLGQAPRDGHHSTRQQAFSADRRNEPLEIGREPERHSFRVHKFGFARRDGCSRECRTNVQRPARLVRRKCTHKATCPK